MEADNFMYPGKLGMMSIKSGPAFEKATKEDDNKIRLQNRSYTGVV